MIGRPVLLSAATTLVFGLYFTMDLAPALWAPLDPFGNADLYFKWDLQRIASTTGCLYASDAIACFVAQISMIWAVPGILLRLAICCVGAAVAGVSAYRSNLGSDIHP